MTFVTQRPTDDGAIRKKRKNQTWNKRAIADYREHDDKFTDHIVLMNLLHSIEKFCPLQFLKKGAIHMINS